MKPSLIALDIFQFLACLILTLNIKTKNVGVVLNFKAFKILILLNLLGFFFDCKTVTYSDNWEKNDDMVEEIDDMVEENDGNWERYVIMVEEIRWELGEIQC